MFSLQTLPYSWLMALYCLLLTTAFCCAKPDNTSPSPTPENQAQGTDSLQQAILVMDGYQIFPDSTAAYYQAVRRKLTYSFYDSHELYILGDTPAQSRPLCHLFLGTYSVEAINDTSFKITAKGGWPARGRWEDGFIEKDFLSFHLIINDRGWQLKQLQFPPLGLTTSQRMIDSLRSVLEEDKSCSSLDWDEAVGCFPTIKQYEYALFAAVTQGDTHQLSEYLDLQRNYNLAYAGEFSAYYTANLYYLLAREIITPDMLQERGMHDRHSWLLRVYGY